MPERFLITIFVCLVVCPVAVIPSTLGANQSVACLAAPELPLPELTEIITVGSVDELHDALANADDNTTVLLRPGHYRLKRTLGITADNVTVRGADNSCDGVQLIGAGMDNPDHQGVEFGIWINARDTTIANLTIRDTYFHSIQIDGNADSPRIFNVHLIDSGQQFIKSNPDATGNGVDNGVVEYSIMEYLNGPPGTDHDNAGVGYTNGVDVHGGTGWRISNNIFRNFHTPDEADHLWNAAVLMWRGSAGTITENNFFLDVDRAIAYGLGDMSKDHSGGVIRNNVVVMSAGLYSRRRARKADAPVIIWHSPGTRVLHNTVITNDNTPFAIESRFDSSDVTIANNLTDAPVVHSEGNIARNLCKFTSLCGKYLSQYSNQNVQKANRQWFVDIEAGDARPIVQPDSGDRRLSRFSDAAHDFTGVARGKSVTAGAFENTFESAVTE